MPKISTRRSAFASWRGQDAVAASSPVPPTPIDLIGAVPKKRNRQWEKEHRTHSYRGVPQGIHNQVVGLASRLQVTTDEIVQVFRAVRSILSRPGYPDHLTSTKSAAHDPFSASQRVGRKGRLERSRWMGPKVARATSITAEDFKEQTEQLGKSGYLSPIRGC